MTHISLIDLARAFWQTNPMDWRFNAEIVQDYMPPYPRKDTKPRLVVRYPYVNEKDEQNHSYLRYSVGPKQGFLWDIYGDDMQNVALAFKALCEAPTPPCLWMHKDSETSVKTCGSWEKAIDKSRSPCIIRYQ